MEQDKLLCIKLSNKVYKILDILLDKLPSLSEMIENNPNIYQLGIKSITLSLFIRHCSSFCEIKTSDFWNNENFNNLINFMLSKIKNTKPSDEVIFTKSKVFFNKYTFSNLLNETISLEDAFILLEQEMIKVGLVHQTIKRSTATQEEVDEYNKYRLQRGLIFESIDRRYKIKYFDYYHPDTIPDLSNKISSKKIYLVFIYTLAGDNTVYHKLYKSLIQLYPGYDLILIDYEQYDTIKIAAQNIYNNIILYDAEYILVGYSYGGTIAMELRNLLCKFNGYKINTKNIIDHSTPLIHTIIIDTYPDINNTFRWKDIKRDTIILFGKDSIPIARHNFLLHKKYIHNGYKHISPITYIAAEDNTSSFTKVYSNIFIKIHKIPNTCHENIITNDNNVANIIHEEIMKTKYSMSNGYYLYKQVLFYQSL